MSDVTEQGYTNLLNYGSDDVLSQVSLGVLEEGGTSITLSSNEELGANSSDMLSNIVTDEVYAPTISGGNLLDGFIIQKDSFIKSDGVIAYNNGTGFYLGWDETLTEYTFFIGNSSGNKLTWDGTTLSITGTITADSGTIGGWVITTGYIYNLQSGTPTSSPNDGVVLASGNEAILVYEDTALRVELGYLSAGVYGLKSYATDGTTILFELSDSRQVIANWTIADGYLYGLTSGTPTSSPNNGTVLAAADSGGVIIYEGTAKRIEMGFLATGVYGVRGYATDGTTILFELSDTRQVIAGWTITDGYIYGLTAGTPTSAPEDGVVLARGAIGGVIVYEDLAKRVEVGFLSAGVYGIKGYATDGTTVLFELSDTLQSMAGWTITNGYLYGLVAGTPTSSPEDGIVLASGSAGGLIIYEDLAKRVEVGFLSTGIYGIKGYATDGTTVLFELSDTQNFIGGWTLGATTFSSVSGGNTTTISSGATAFSCGPTGSPTFTVTQAGVVTATNINIATNVQYQSVTSDITGTELETLSSGAASDASNLHTHTLTNIFNKMLAIDGFYYQPLDIQSADFVEEQSGVGNSVSDNIVHTEYRADDEVGDGITSNVGTSMIGAAGGASYSIWDRSWIAYWFVDFDADGGSAYDVYWGGGRLVADGGTVAADATFTGRHAGFFIQDGTTYASNANGTTQTKTDISASVTLTNVNVYSIEFTTASIAFKINGTTAATHTTNIPAGDAGGTSEGFSHGITSQDTLALNGANFSMGRLIHYFQDVI